MPADPEAAIELKNRREWRRWLTRNFRRPGGVWLIHYKKRAAKQGLTHEEAVEEALCFGWIDSQLKRLDEERYFLKYTPRKPGSVWSKINKEKAEKLTALGQMTKAGLAKIEEAEKRGSWQNAYTNLRKEKLPAELAQALMNDGRARKNFFDLANTYRNMFIYWIVQAKTAVTRARRVKEVVRRAAKNLKPGEQ